MSAGTKIFLAFVGLFVLILVLYYGVLVSDDQPSVVYDERARPHQAESQETVQEDTRTRTGRRRAASRVERDAPLLRQQPDDPVARPSMPRPSEPVASPSVSGSDELEIGSDVDEVDSPSAGSEDEQEKAKTENGEQPGHVRPLNDAPLFTVAPADLRRPNGEQPVRQEDDDDGEPDDVDDDLRAATPDNEPDLDKPAAEPSEEAEEAKPIDAAPALPERPQYTKYVVEAGDTLSTIAEEWFGNANKWDLIAKANPRVDPLRLRIGMELRLPPTDTEREDTGAKAPDHETMYTVRSGDNLSRIAHMYYSDSSLWRLIFDVNRETLRNDPDRLRVGMQLRIPPAPAPAEEES